LKPVYQSDHGHFYCDLTNQNNSGESRRKYTRFVLYAKSAKRVSQSPYLLRYNPFAALQGKDHPFISDDDANLLVPLPYAFLVGKIQRLSRFQAAGCLSNGSL